MICNCGSRTIIIESRPVSSGVKRRHECRESGERFTTYEGRPSTADMSNFTLQQLINKKNYLGELVAAKKRESI